MQKLVKIPGLVDVHVHFREPGATYKEDFTTGTQAAIAGGYTQVLDMPNNNPPTISPDSLEDKISAAKNRIYCDLGFNFGATGESAKFFNKVQKKVFAIKIYMGKTTGSLLVEDSKEKELIFKSWNSNKPIMVHANGDVVKEAIALGRKFKRRIHICHITADQIDTLKKARKTGIQITAEVCPHHLFLTIEDLKRLGPLAMMKPPLGTKIAQQKLWDNLEHIDMISTDHAPHTLDEKSNSTEPVYGVPGLETTIPLLFGAIEKKLISLERLIEMTSTAPRKIFNLPAQPNTYVVVEKVKKYKLLEKNLYTKCSWTPFMNFESTAIVKEVFLRGKRVFLDGKFLSKPSGKVIFQS